jgi:molybdopterin converting factor small subunit
MVEIHLYGNLRRHASDPRPDQESVVRLEPQPGETVGTTLERLGISFSEVYHIFLNGALLSTRNSMAPWLKYQKVHDDVSEQASSRVQGLDTPIQSGDRLGLFARDMGLLVI